MRIFICVVFLLVSGAVSANEAVSTKTATRIVALAPHITEMLFEIGAGDNIVATVDYANHPEAAKAIPRIGGHYGINIEKLVMLQPDVVLFWQGGNKAQDLAKMQQLGLNVVALPSRNFNDLVAALLTLGQLSGFQQQAEIAVEKFLITLSHIKNSYKGKQPMSVFYSLWSEPLMTVNKDSWINELITSCNADNIFSNSAVKTPNVSIENILVAQPEIIVIPDAFSDVEQPTDIWQNWEEIPAVAKQQIIHVNGDVMHRFSPKMLEGLADMCQQIDAFRR